MSVILVVGDVMTDTYHCGTARPKLSAEAPIPIVDITSTLSFAGGAGNVVANLQSLGATVHLACSHLIPQKHRLLCDGVQIARWDENDYCTPIDLPGFEQLLSKIFNNGVPIDGVIVADYGKGSVTREIVEAVGDLLVPVYVDTKRNPTFFTEGVGIEPHLVTFFPNELEYKAFEEEYLAVPHMILKRGAHGMSEFRYGVWVQTAAAQAEKVVSVCGAGDTVIAAYAFAELSGCDDPIGVAAHAAAIVVEKPYTATASLEELNVRYVRNRSISK